MHRRGFTDHEPQSVPISTYNAYAAALVADHGLRVGVEPTARLLSEAAAWQLAADIVQRWDADLADVEAAPTTVTEAVLALAGECAEHLVDPDVVDDLLAHVTEHVAALPARLGEVSAGPPRPAVRDRLARLAAKRSLLPVVLAFQQRKRELDVLDFGDQVALAARIALHEPDVGKGERARYRVVLLDEYQDTSHAQLSLLRALFGGAHPVVAVGDPHQSIYGWRGASAGNLQRFPVDFPGTDGAPAATSHLATSWRNDTAVLLAANRVSAALREGGAPGRERDLVVPVPPLDPRPGAGAGRVQVQWLPTVEDEARAVADVAEAEWHAGRSGEPAGPSVAVLCRTRGLFAVVEAALRAKGLPVEVVGLGGLLSVPEVADLRATLEVVHDPTRGDSLMRLLVGPALRLGPRDLEALSAWSSALAHRAVRAPVGPAATGSGSAAAGPPTGAVTETRGLPRVIDPADERSIVDGLDRLPPTGWAGPAGQRLSVEGARRLSRLGSVLRDLRGRAGSLPLADLVLDVERALLLDVEVASVPGCTPAAARANLDAFVDVAAGFADQAASGARAGAAGHLGNGARAGLGAFLAWLDAADARERGLETPVTQVRPDAVQVMTVHAAKGLEWDVVAVVGLVEGTFPSGASGRAPTSSNGWMGDLGALPYPLRGDAHSLPRWEVQAARTQGEAVSALEDFRTRCSHHEVAEERRLMYVALTRARRRLLLTGAVWGEGSTPRQPSRFLAELAELAELADLGRPAGLAEAGPLGVSSTWTPAPPAGATNPREALVRSATWPPGPAAPRRAELQRGADLVRAAQRDADQEGSRSDAAAGWDREVRLLLRERDRAVQPCLDVVLPAHLSASRVVAMAADPHGLANRLRRPMPEPPNPYARRGSAFHAWLERRFGAAALVDVDELPGAADDAVADGELAALQARFLSSEWAERSPEAVEVAVETPVGGLLVRGRIDAVFGSPGPDGPHWDVVDWKTGPPPDGAAQAAERAVQLALYRLAWARLQGVPVERVGAAFFYASTGQTVRPARLLDEAEITTLLDRAVATGSREGSPGLVDDGVEVGQHANGVVDDVVVVTGDPVQ